MVSEPVMLWTLQIHGVRCTVVCTFLDSGKGGNAEYSLAGFFPGQT